MILRGFTTDGTGEKLTPFPDCGGGGSGTDTDDQQAVEVPYDNSGSGLTAEDVQEAIDELTQMINECCNQISSGLEELSSGGEEEEMAFSGARVKKTSDQTGANYSAGVAMAFDAEDFDVGGWHDNVTENTKLIVPSGVAYVEVTGTVDQAAGTINNVGRVHLRKDGSTFVGMQEAGAGITDNRLTCTSGPVAVSPGDYFELIYTNADTSVNIIAANTRFSIKKLG